MEKHLRELINLTLEAQAHRDSFAAQAAADPSWNPYFHSTDLDADGNKVPDTKRYKTLRQTGRSVKSKYSASNPDRAFLNSLITIHWASSRQKLFDLLTNVSRRDELSASAYLPNEIKLSSGWGGDWGLIIKGHISLLSNDMDSVLSGKGSKYHEANPEWAKQSGASKGVGRTYHPDSYKMGKSIFVFDKEDWAPETSFIGDVSNEALVANWTPISLIVPDDEYEKWNKISQSPKWKEMFGDLNVISYSTAGKK